jgi:hypothetical protein
MNVIHMCGIIATSQTTSTVLSTLVKIKRIRVWSPVATAGTSVIAAIQWPNNSSVEQIAGPPVVMSDSSSSISQYAHVDTKPPKGSWTDKWHHASDTTPWFFLTASIGSIIDFDLKWFLDDLGVTANGPTIIAGVIGSIYHRDVNNCRCTNLNFI